MKDLRKNITSIFIVLIIVFTILAGYMLYDVLVYSGRWVSSSYNPRLREKRSAVIPGSIYDVNGTELAGSSGYQRTYIQDDDIRLSVSQVIGDFYGFSPLGVETTQGAYVLGLNETLSDRIVRVLNGETAHGSDITLTIDAKINSQISQLLSGNNCAVTVLNYKTGEILSMVSLPQFDLKDIDVSKVNGGASKSALFNRVLQGQYTPGEIFQIVVAGAAMENLDLKNSVYECTGSYTVEGEKIFCDAVHRQQSFEEAFANTCTSAFGQINEKLNAKQLLNYSKELGFDYQFLFSDVVLYESDISLTAHSSDYETAMAVAGLEGVKMTPMHMAMIYGAIPNGGKIVPLKLISSVEDGKNTNNTDFLRKAFDYSTAEKLDEMLKDANPISVSDFSVYGIVDEHDTTDEEYQKLTIYAGYSDEDFLPYSISLVIEDFDGSMQDVENFVREIYLIILENTQ